MVKHLKTCFALSALAIIVSAFSMASKPFAASAISNTYTADTVTPVTSSSLVSGARYLMCQYSAKTSKYEVLNGSDASTIRIPFLAPDYASVVDLENGASSVASRYVTFEKASEGVNNWYLRRNSDNYYFCSNGSSDLVFSSSNVYSSANRTYFVPSVGSDSSLIRFSISSDSTLYLGTKVDGAYFDTWHDVSSVAAKDFLLYRVYNQDEEAANFAASFDSAIGSTCDLDGNTSLASLHNAWATMGGSWSKLSSPAQDIIKSVIANSDAGAEETAKCKAKYLYIVSKYSADSSVDDFMGLRPSDLLSLPSDGKETDRGLGVALALLLLGGAFGVLAIAYRSGRKQKE